MKSLVYFNKINRDKWVAEQARQVPNGARVLDMGAGGAPYRSLFAHCVYETQDFCGLQSDQLTQGQYGHIDYVCDATSVPVNDNTYDVVLSTEMLEHAPRPIAVVHEISRILKPGGKLLLTAPLGSGVHQEPFHFYGGYTPYWYDKYLIEAGLENIIIETNGGSFAHFSQWCVWVAKATAPWNLGLTGSRLVVAPLWLLIVPMTALLFIYGHFMDRFDSKKQFTVGYHVTATKKQ